MDSEKQQKPVVLASEFASKVSDRRVVILVSCNAIKTISIAQYTVQTAARALNIVNKQYTLSQTE